MTFDRITVAVVAAFAAYVGLSVLYPAVNLGLLAAIMLFLCIMVWRRKRR